MRNTLYGLQLGATLRPRGWVRLPVALLTIDDSTAVAGSQSNTELRRLGFWVTGIGIWIGWNTMTIVGAVAGQALGEPKQYGLDAAAAAPFVALIWPRLRVMEPVAVAAARTTAFHVPMAPEGLPVFVAALVGGIVAWFWPRVYRQRSASDSEVSS